MQFFKNRSLLVFYILLLCTSINAQKAQDVPSITKEIHDISWYKEQELLWEKEVKKNPKNEKGWVNYYTAVRMQWVLQNFAEPEAKRKLDVVNKVEKAIPDSYAFNFLRAWDMGVWEPSALKYAEKAYELQPENPAIYNELVIRYDMKGELLKRKAINNKWFSSNTFSPGLLNYNYNVLASLDKNAIIFTVGDNDTYPLWMIQDIHGFREDVIICNMSMMYMNDYREHIFNRANIVNNPSVRSSLVNTVPKFEQKDWEQKLIKSVMENSNGRPVYIGLTAGTPDWVKSMEDNLYLIGLASVYSNKKIDNIALIKRNYEQKFLLDYLTANFQSDVSKGITDLCNQNYIPPFLVLYNHYKTSGENNKAESIRQYLMKLAEQSKNKEEILNLIKE